MDSTNGTQTTGHIDASRSVAGRPGWAVKPLADLTTGELADVLAYLDSHDLADDVLTRALAGRLADRTAVPC